MGGKSKKQPTPQGIPNLKVPPKWGAPKLKEPPKKFPGLPGTNNSGERLCWRFMHVDHEGPWGFDRVTPEEMCDLMRCLAKFETMTVGEAFPGGGYPGKDYVIEEIPTAAARERLDALGLADMTKISVFRLTGEQRLYGFRTANVFHVVWWDPLHEVWPSKKKHT
jgi:hypothetical protein